MNCLEAPPPAWRPYRLQGDLLRAGRGLLFHSLPSINAVVGDETPAHRARFAHCHLPTAYRAADVQPHSRYGRRGVKAAHATSESDTPPNTEA
jgi:hypothetical protein